MCQQCNYPVLMRARGLANIPNRLRILEIIGNSSAPLSAHEIYETMKRTQTINRVTVYRIVDLLVAKGLLSRITLGDRSFRYGLAPNDNHPPHSHFLCRLCGVVECLNPGSLRVEMDSLTRTFPGMIEKAEVNVEGVCKTCLRHHKRHEASL